MQELVLYSRHACHLCEVMAAELSPYLADGGIRLNIVDVDERQDWRNTYGDRVPVLATPDGRVLCEYHLDEAVLQDWLNED